MVCPPVQGDNPRALVSGLSPIQTDKLWYYYFMSLSSVQTLLSMKCSGLPRSGKNIWKMKFFAGQGQVRELCGLPGKFRKDLESQGI